MKIKSYCPICAEFIGDEPFCSDCEDVSGSKSEEYNSHDRQYYINKQINIFGKVLYEPKNYLEFKIGDRIYHPTFRYGTILGNRHMRGDGHIYWHIGYEDGTFGYNRETNLRLLK